MKKKCSECNKLIGFGGSWKIDEKIVCSKCEKKIRLARETEKKEEASSIEKPVYLKKDEEIGNVKKYCSECGTKLTRESKFCINCGAKVGKTKSFVGSSEKQNIDTDFEENGENEEIMGIFPGMKIGKLAPKCFKLVFTTSRLIMTREKRLLPGKMGAPYYIFSKVSARDRLKMKQQSVEAILKENPENYEISYANITALEFKTVKLYRTELQIFTEGNLDVPHDKIIVDIGPKYMNDFQIFLQTVLPGKI